MYYCSVYKHWDYHNTPGKDVWKSTQGGASGTGGNSSAATTAVGDRDDLDNKLISFIV